MALSPGQSDSLPKTGTQSAVQGYPTVNDFAQSNQFAVWFEIFPEVTFSVTRVNIPGMTLGSAILPTPLLDIPFVGEKLVFDNIDMTFIVDEQLKNYQEVHNWMVNIGFPRGHDQFQARDRPDGAANRNVLNPSVYGQVPGTAEGYLPDRNLYSRIAVDILSSKNNPLLRVEFLEAWPIALGALQYGVDNSDTDYLLADVSFQYMLYEFKSMG